MPLASKVCQGHLVIGLFICLSVRYSDPPTYILLSAILKVWMVIQNQTSTVISSKGCCHFTDITCLLGKEGWKCRTSKFCQICLFAPWDIHGSNRQPIALHMLVGQYGRRLVCRSLFTKISFQAHITNRLKCATFIVIYLCVPQ